jgi:hypothetical protein
MQKFSSLIGKFSLKGLLDFIYNISLKRGKVLLIAMAFITMILGAFIPRLIISSSQQNLIPKDDPEQARYIKYKILLR